MKSEIDLDLKNKRQRVWSKRRFGSHLPLALSAAFVICVVAEDLLLLHR